MDAKNIFIVCQAKLRQVEWERPAPDSEWSYVGEPNNLRITDLQEALAEFIAAPQVFIVTDRHHSRAVNLLQSALEVRELMKHGEVTVCDHSFERFMVFNALGVMKRGRHRTGSIAPPEAGG